MVTVARPATSTRASHPRALRTRTPTRTTPPGPDRPMGSTRSLTPAAGEASDRVVATVSAGEREESLLPPLALTTTNWNVRGCAPAVSLHPVVLKVNLARVGNHHTLTLLLAQWRSPMDTAN